MIDDLREINRLIARHWLGKLDPDQEDYIGFTPVCVGQCSHGAAELAQVLARLKEDAWSRHSVGELNRRYLTFARLAARDMSAEGLDMLLRLGLTLRQAAFLRALSDSDLDRLAFGSAGPMMRFAAQSFRRGVTLHVQVSQHHATALVAAQQATEEAPR
jgi:hypothetical protein